MTLVAANGTPLPLAFDPAVGGLTAQSPTAVLYLALDPATPSGNYYVHVTDRLTGVGDQVLSLNDPLDRFVTVTNQGGGVISLSVPNHPGLPMGLGLNGLGDSLPLGPLAPNPEDPCLYKAWLSDGWLTPVNPSNPFPFFGAVTSYSFVRVLNCGGGAPCCEISSAIGSNFNGTAIPAGRSIWFNAIVKVSNLPAAGGTVGYRNGVIAFAANGVNYALPVPSADITFDPLAASAVTTFDPIAFRFHTVVPAGYSGNVFLSGLSLPVGTALPGGINPVTWSGQFQASEPACGVSFQWKWAAAVYTSFTTDYNALCIKPIDGSAQNPYPNSHHAGSPECWLPFVVGGARGGGGSNFTGSYSGTKSVTCQ